MKRQPVSRADKFTQRDLDTWVHGWTLTHGEGDRALVATKGATVVTAPDRGTLLARVELVECGAAPASRGGNDGGAGQG